MLNYSKKLATVSDEEKSFIMWKPGLEVLVVAEADGMHQARVNVGTQQIGHGLDGGIAKRVFALQFKNTNKIYSSRINFLSIEEFLTTGTTIILKFVTFTAKFNLKLIFYLLSTLTALNSTMMFSILTQISNLMFRLQ